MDRVKNESGGVSTILIIFVLGTVIFFYLSQAITPLLVQKNQIANKNVKTRLMIAMENLKANLNNTEAFKSMVNHADNSSLACLANGTCAYGGAPMDFYVYSLDGVSLSKGQLYGINRQGQPCSASEDACVFITSVQWSPICPADGSPCINPQIEIHGEVKFKNLLGNFPLNLKDFRFRLQKKDVGMLIN